MSVISRHRRWTVIAGGSIAVLLSLAVSSCTTNDSEPSDNTTTIVTSTSPTSALAPTEKSVDPTGANLFTPPVRATPAPNVQPNPEWWLPK